MLAGKYIIKYINSEYCCAAEKCVAKSICPPCFVPQKVVGLFFFSPHFHRKYTSFFFLFFCFGWLVLSCFLWFLGWLVGF